jgi:hypothetical protein
MRKLLGMVAIAAFLSLGCTPATTPGNRPVSVPPGGAGAGARMGGARHGAGAPTGGEKAKPDEPPPANPKSEKGEK